ncbi:MAG: hypothetical protein U1A06_17100, partial [Hoeflea sp.]|nr:hypothetical protein [Hoeflea sp.]
MKKPREDKNETSNKAKIALLSSTKSPIDITRIFDSTEAQITLQRAVARITELDRDSTAHAFKLGETFAEVKSIVPEKSFGKWLNGFSNYSVRSAWNYTSVHERLQDHREQLVASAVMPSVMFVLAKCDPPLMESLVARIATGERLKVKDVKLALGGAPKQESNISPLDVGGLAGLRKASDVKMATDMAEFQRLTKSILAEVEDAVKPLAEGKRVVKNSLAAMIELDCRHACELLNAIIAPLTPYAFDERRTWRPVELDKSTGWGQAQKLLHRLGMEPDWPGSTEFGPWVRDEVMPMLRFVVHGEPLNNLGASQEVVPPLLDSSEDMDIAE